MIRFQNASFVTIVFLVAWPSSAVAQFGLATRFDDAERLLPPGVLTRIGNVPFSLQANGVTGLVVSPDGKYVVVKGQPHQMFELATGRRVPIGVRNTSENELVTQWIVPYQGLLCVNVISFANGQYSTRIVDLFTSQFRFNGPSGSIDEFLSSMDLRSDGRKLVFTTRPNRAGQVIEVRELDIASGLDRVLWNYPPEKGSIQTSYSPDGEKLWIRSGPHSAQAEVRQIATGKFLVERERSEDMRQILGFTQDSRQFLYISQYFDEIRRIDATTGEALSPIPIEHGCGKFVRFSPDGRQMLFRLWDGLEIRNAATGRIRFHVPFVAQFVHVEYTPDSRHLVAAANGHLSIHDAQTGRLISGPTFESDVTHLHWSPDSRQLATASGPGDPCVRIWSADTGRLEHTFETTARGFAGLMWSPAGDRLAAIGTDSYVREWSVLTGAMTRGIQTDLERPVGVAYAIDRKSLFAIGHEAWRTWDENCKSIAYGAFKEVATRVFPLRSGRLVVAYNPVAQAHVDHLLYDFDPLTGKRIFQTRVESSSFKDLSPTASFSLVGYMHTTADLVRLSDGRRRELGTIDSWKGPAAFSRDGRLVALGGWGTEVEIFEHASGSILKSISIPEPNVTALAWSPDGRRLAISCGRRIYICDTTPSRRPSSLEAAWTGLLDSSAIRGVAASQYWLANPDVAVRVFAERIKPAAAIDRKKFARTIRMLDSDEFAEREAATKELADSGALIREQLGEALRSARSAETRQRLEVLLSALDPEKPATGESLRRLRVVEILELIDTPAARQLLAKLASGVIEADLTRDAKASLARLTRPT